MSENVNDGQVPFADRRYRRDEMVDRAAPPELAEFLEREIGGRAISLPFDDFLEIRCESESFATAVFMVRRGPSGEIRLLVPQNTVRNPN